MNQSSVAAIIKLKNISSKVLSIITGLMFLSTIFLVANFEDVSEEMNIENFVKIHINEKIVAIFIICVLVIFASYKKSLAWYRTAMGTAICIISGFIFSELNRITEVMYYEYYINKYGPWVEKPDIFSGIGFVVFKVVFIFMIIIISIDLVINIVVVCNSIDMKKGKINIKPTAESIINHGINSNTMMSTSIPKRYCSMCGKLINANHKFCGFCGKEF